MSEIQGWSDTELHERTVAAAKKEQEATLLTLAHLREVERRRLHLKMGFGSLFRYAVEALGFSEPAAASRIQAMRLAAAVPEAEARLRSGELKLSSAAAIQRFVRQEEKATGRSVPAAEQAKLVEELAGQSYRQAERLLLGHSQRPEAHRQKERTRAVTPTRSEVRFYADPGLLAQLERVRELKGDRTLEAIFAEALTHYLRKIDPTARRPERARRQESTPTSECGKASASKPQEAARSVKPERSAKPAESAESVKSAQPVKPAVEDSRYVPAALRRQVYERSEGRCEYTDPGTGRRCESRARPRIDHEIPFALGGPTSRENLRQLCARHNELEAIRVFGPDKMRPYVRV